MTTRKVTTKTLYRFIKESYAIDTSIIKYMLEIFEQEPRETLKGNIFLLKSFITSNHRFDEN
jgi:hypothetical protein